MTGEAGAFGFCHLCGRPLDSRLRRFHHPAWPPELSLRVCAVCAAGSRCQSCGLPVGGGGARVDGRPLCVTCEATAVVSADEATRVYRAAEGIIREQLGLSLNVPTGLTLVERDELDAVLRDMGEGPDSGGETLGVYTRRGRQRGIYAAVGLPRRLLLQVAAHELAHAWQMENAPLLRDPLLREGFAEWVAYHVLLAVGEPEAAERIVAREDTYGQGLRRLLAIEGQAGVPGVIAWCRRAR